MGEEWQTGNDPSPNFSFNLSQLINIDKGIFLHLFCKINIFDIVLNPVKLLASSSSGFSSTLEITDFDKHSWEGNLFKIYTYITHYVFLYYINKNVYQYIV